jgi:hypothetical protein
MSRYTEIEAFAVIHFGADVACWPRLFLTKAMATEDNSHQLHPQIDAAEDIRGTMTDHER